MTPSLTDLIRHLPLPTRIKYRRRIEMIADWWALKLQHKHGGKALYRCRRHMVATTKNGAALRNHIWSQVNRRLKQRSAANLTPRI